MKTLELKRLTLQEKMSGLAKLVKLNGYRYLTREDLVGGAELMMLDVERYFSCQPYAYRDPAVCSDRIKLDEDPVRLFGGEDYVFYHAISPRWAGQCLVPIKHFLATGYLDGQFNNDHRYIVRRK